MFGWPAGRGGFAKDFAVGMAARLDGSEVFVEESKAQANGGVIC